MRKLLLLLTTVLGIFFANAQSTANYALSTGTTGSLAALSDVNVTAVDMSAGTTQLVAGSTDNGASLVTNIGFNFFFMGVNYSQFSANSNGIIRLGGTAIATATYVIGAASQALISPIGGDLETSSTGKVHFKLVGSAPNRCLVVEFLNMGLDYTGSPYANPDGTYQARLYETTGVIEFVYGAMARNSSASNTSSFNIGFSSNSTANNLLSVTNTSTNTTSLSAVTTLSYSTGAIADLNSASNGSRKYYTFTPAALSAPITLTFSSVGVSNTTIGWTDNSTNENTFIVTRATDAAFTTNVVTSTVTSTTLAGTGTTYSFLQTGLSANTTYYYSVAAVAENVSTGLTGNQITTSCASGISSTKSVGPTGDFATITAALTGGISGATILELQSTYTSTGETFPIAFPLCSNSGSTLTIRPEVGATGLVITSSNTIATIDLNGVSYVAIDGRPGGLGTTSQLSITNTSIATGGTAVRFINDANNNTLSYLGLKSEFASATSGVVVFSTGVTNGNDNNTITFCNIDGGAGATASPTTVATNGIYSSGSATTTLLNNSSNTVNNCNIFDYFSPSLASNGILISAGSTDWVITGNSFYQTNPRTSTAGNIHGAISVLTGNNFTISNNIIGGSNSAAGGIPWTLNGAFANRFIGINLTVGTTTPTSVQNNTITNLNMVTSSGLSSAPGIFCGIYLNGGTANIGTTTKNTIGNGTGNSSILVTTTTTAAISTGISVGNASTTASSISNNVIGSITLMGSTTSIAHNFMGIEIASYATLQTLTINNNLIGSLTTSNSINLGTALTGTLSQGITGIRCVSSNPVCIITNNTIANLNNAAVSSGSTTYARGIVMAASPSNITGNTIRNLTTACINAGTTTSAALQGITNPSSNATVAQTISNNTIHTLVNTNTTNGVSVIGIIANWSSTATTLTCSKNLIHSLRSSGIASCNIFGIYIGAGAATYSNNMIRLGLDETGNSLTVAQNIAGINEALGTNTIVHNSVYIGGTGVAAGANNTYAFWAQQTTNARVFRNNIFVNDRQNGAGTGLHLAAQYAGTFTNSIPATGLTLNNNIYFARTTANTIRQGATTYTLASWRNYSGCDALSGVASDTTDINFINARGAAVDLNLHLQGTTVAEGAGVTLAAITDDFDGQTRSGLTPVDIGADAGNFTAKDIFAPAVSYTATTGTVYGYGNVTISATIVDATGVINTGSLQPKIYFNKNAGAYSSTVGVRASGTDNNGTWTFTIDHAALGGVVATDVIRYYIIAQDNAATPNVISNPLNAIATDVNTITTVPTILNSYTIAAGISWVGTTSTDWNDATNWSTNVVPTGSDNITIGTPSGNMPVVGSGVTAVAGIVYISNTGSTLTVNGTGSLAVTSISNTGTINASAGTLNVTAALGTGITNNTGSNFNINGGTVNLGPQDNTANNRVFSHAGGTLNVSSGTLNIAGVFNVSNGTFNQSGGDINVDFNGTVSATAPAPAVNFTGGTYNLSAGKITIVDPSATTTVHSFSYAGSSIVICTGTHTVQFGDGVSTQAGTTDGFILSNTGTRFNFRNLTINGTNLAANRFVKQAANSNAVAGNFTINANSEYRQSTYSLYLAGNLTNNGVLVSDGTSGDALQFMEVSTGFLLPVTIPQTVSGSGAFNNAITSPFAFATAITSNNTSSSGVTFATGLTPIVSGSLTVTAGKLNADALSLLGTTTLAVALTAPTSSINVTNLTINKTSGTATLSGSGFLNVTGTVTPTFGTLAAGGRLVLKSTSTGTARVTTVGATAAITGNVNVERFIPAGNRAFRFLTPSVTTTGTIRANWQEGQNNTTTSLNSNTNPGYGTHITGSTTGANGFDATLTGNPSMYTFDNTSTATDQNTVWSPIANTDVLGLSAGTGYRIMVRGSRAVDLTTNTPTIDATTLRSTGTLLTGAVTMNSTASTPRLSATASYYSLVGNPYASPISWSALTKTDLTSYYYAWDPTQGTKGAYVSHDGTTSSNPTGSAVSNVIQPGQAFFVQNASSVTAPALVFQEAHKTTGNTSVFRTQSDNAILGTQLMLTANATNNHTQDGVTVVFNNNYNNAVDDEDANKLTNPGENIAVERNNKLMSIEKRSLPTINDTIQLKLWQLAQDNYTLRFNGSNFATNLNAYLQDSYLNNETPINLNGTTDYNFTTTSTAATTAANRFTIVFRSSNALPVNILNVSAAQKNAGIEVNWNTASESNMDSYEVEESSNATTFTKAATVAAKNGASNAYNWFDATVNNGDNYYRIKAIEKNGTVKYSNVVKVKIGGKAAEFTVYPNPVKDGIVSLQMSNVEKGIYTVKIFNNAGQEVANRIITSNGGSSTQTITLGKGTAKGNYKMQITGGTTLVTKSVIVN